MAEYVSTRIAYGQALEKIGEDFGKVVVLDADLSHATMTCTFAEKYPDRFFNAGIAEQNLMCMAAGMSLMDTIPFASTFAIFGAGRAYEQIRNSIAYPNLNVKIALTHAGITLGEDGGSHQSIEDIALMRVVPNMKILVPCDAKQTYSAVKLAAQLDGPVYIRLARLPSLVFEENFPMELGKSNIIKDGSDVVIFVCGTLLETAMEAAKQLKGQGIDAAVVNMYSIKPIDSDVIRKYAKKCKKVVTFEEHSVIGGLGDAVLAEVVGEEGLVFRKVGVQDRFGQSGKPSEVLNEYGLASENLVHIVRSM